MFADDISLYNNSTNLNISVLTLLGIVKCIFLVKLKFVKKYISNKALVSTWHKFKLTLYRQKLLSISLLIIKYVCRIMQNNTAFCLS